ncbi:MAG: hypothetical protein R6W75_04175 [Smithellaceae bacterium]
MLYSCINCKATLMVDPMDMLGSFCARGVPVAIEEAPEKNPRGRAILQTGRILQLIPKRISALKFH